MKKTVLLMLLILALLLPGCAQEQPVTPEQKEAAQNYLDSIFMSATLNVPNENGGIFLPDNLPADSFSIEVTGIAADNTKVDLMEGKEVLSGDWLIFEGLNQFTRVDVSMNIYHDGVQIVGKTANLLEIF